MAACTDAAEHIVLPAAAAPHVAAEMHVDAVRLALQDVGIYLAGAQYEVRHRADVVALQLQVWRPLKQWP